MRRATGFTLIEMIMVIVILSILAAGSTNFISFAAKGYADSARRQSLTQTATLAMEKMTRELRLALPNSVRFTTDTDTDRVRCVEFVPIKVGSNYRESVQNDELTSFTALPAINRAQYTGRIAIYPDTTEAVYGTDSPGPAVSAPVATLPAPGDGVSEVEVDFEGNSTHTFPQDSPEKRFFVVDSPVA